MKSTATKFSIKEFLSHISRTELSEILLAGFDAVVEALSAPEPVEGWMLVKRTPNTETNTTDTQEVMFFYDYRAALEALKEQVRVSSTLDIFWDLKAGALVDTPEEPTQEEPGAPVPTEEQIKAANEIAAKVDAEFEESRIAYESHVLALGRVLTPQENIDFHRARHEAKNGPGHRGHSAPV